jgi:hypothetical protein
MERSSKFFRFKKVCGCVGQRREKVARAGNVAVANPKLSKTFFRSSEDATVARKLGKWLTVVPKEEEETARNGLNKQETASNKHSQPRRSTLFTEFPE